LLPHPFIENRCCQTLFKVNATERDKKSRATRSEKNLRQSFKEIINSTMKEKPSTVPPVKSLIS